MTITLQTLKKDTKNVTDDSLSLPNDDLETEDNLDDQAEQKYTWTTNAEQVGKRLDKVLGEVFPSFSRSRIQSLIDNGHVTCQQAGRTLTSARKVQEGWDLEMLIPPLVDVVPVAENIPLNVVFEDKDILVINKPVGMAVHAGAGITGGTVVNAVLFHAGDSLSGIGGAIRPGIVHRIDKDTSGLLMIAKNDQSHVYLSRQLERHTVDRTYHALVWGIPAYASGRVETFIGRSRHDRKKMAVLEKDGKKAITHWKVLEKFIVGTYGVACLVECRLETGRTHQIRVHMTHMGHSLIGDAVYGGGHKASLKKLPDTLKQVLESFPRQALHAKTLGFYHPKQQENRLSFTSELPDDMQHLLDCLRNH